MTTFTIDHEVRAGLDVVTPVGDIDIASVVTFRKVLDQVMGAGRTSDERVPVVIDLTAVPFMDSSGIGALITLYKQSLATKNDVSLAGCTASVRHVLIMMGLDHVLPLHDSIAAARHHYAAAAR